MPPVTEHQPDRKKWPKIKTNAGTEIRATQRDLRRWKILYGELHKLQHETTYAPYHDSDEDEEEEDEGDRTNLLGGTANGSTEHTGNKSNDDPEYDDDLIESTTWSQLAYNGFMWWASAGEEDATVNEEAGRDREILGDLSDFMPLSPRASRMNGTNGTSAADMSSSMASLGGSDAGIHTAIIAYFHRLTAIIVSTLADIVDAADDEVAENAPDESEDDSQVSGKVTIRSEEIGRMGLDQWSEADRTFARDMLTMYFGRDAVVHSASIECCGVRIY
jgi:hypothetical protein